MRLSLALNPKDEAADYPRSSISLVTSQVMILLTLIMGDTLLASGRPDWIQKEVWAVIDAPIHSLLGILITWPLVVRSGSRRRILLRLALATLAPMLIDIDHFVAAGSLSLYDATHLDGRPVTHSLGFAILSGLVAWKATRDPGDGILLLTALSSHLLRDASGGGIPYLLWPFKFFKLPMPLYYVAQLGLSLIAWMGSSTLMMRGERLRLPVKTPSAVHERIVRE